MYVHGGGWVLGNLDSHDDICADICRQTESTVLAIDYRLAPEHPFPAALHDCIDVLNALTVSTSDRLAKLQPDSLVLAGDSAGANLVTAACLSGAWPASDVFKGLVLFYPGLSANDALPAFQEHREAPLLPQPFLDFFVHAYLHGGTIEPTVLTSPLLATDLSAIPACHIAAAEHDPLRDDAIVFTEKLQAQGIACSLDVLASLGHGFLRVRRSSEPARTAFEDACKAMMALHTGQFSTTYGSGGAP
jgi:acetyl esterase